MRTRKRTCSSPRTTDLSMAYSSGRATPIKGRALRPALYSFTPDRLPDRVCKGRSLPPPVLAIGSGHALQLRLEFAQQCQRRRMFHPADGRFDLGMQVHGPEPQRGTKLAGMTVFPILLCHV